MANKKETTLSIVIRAVDQTTARLRAIHARIRDITAPLRARLSSLNQSGVGALIGVFKRVGSVIGEVLSKIPLIGGAIAATVGGALLALKSFIDGFDELGDKAEAIGVSVDFLAQMRFAAEKSGAEVAELDTGLQGFSKSLGEARAGTGRMASFLGRVSPALLKQLKATKSNEEALDLLANAMAKIEDPAKRAALAQKTLGNASLAPLFARGAKGVQELRQRYAELAGSQAEAVAKSGEVDDAMKDLKASTDGIKAALVTGLAPALKIIVERLRDWFSGNRENIAAWAKSFGEKLPGAIQKVVAAISAAIDKAKAFFAELSAIITAADMLINGPKELKGMTPEEFMRGDFKRVALRNQLAGTEDLTATERAARSQQLRTEAAAMTAGEHSQQDAFIAEAKFAAAQMLREGTDTRRAIADLSRRDDFSGFMDRVRTTIGVPRSAPTEAKVTIDIANAPRGTRVATDPKSTADVDLSVGYQLWGTP